MTSGGRVMTVVGHGPTFEAAIDRAYDAASRDPFDGMQFRRDIGRKALRMKYAVVTFGCRVNQADSLAHRGRAVARGRGSGAGRSRRSGHRQYVLGDGERRSGRAADHPPDRA